MALTLVTFSVCTLTLLVSTAQRQQQWQVPVVAACDEVDATGGSSSSKPSETGSKGVLAAVTAWGSVNPSKAAARVWKAKKKNIN
jgi:hypothetical protein